MSCRHCAFMFFFFFQAEDGIRDYKVTGVQTCALPISAQKPQACRHPGVLEHAGTRIHSGDVRGITDNPCGGAGEKPRAGPDVEHPHPRLQARIPEGPAAVPGAGPQSDNALEAIVVGGGAIENAAHPRAALAFGPVVRAQWWMRCWHET